MTPLENVLLVYTTLDQASYMSADAQYKSKHTCLCTSFFAIHGAERAIIVLQVKKRKLATFSAQYTSVQTLSWAMPAAGNH